MSTVYTVQTNIYRRKSESGTEFWMVRWKSLVTGRWQTMTAGRSKQEALLVEARLRQALARGEDPSQIKRSEVESLTVNDVLDRFYLHSRFQSATKRWQKEVRQKIENDIRHQLGRRLFSSLDQESVFQFYLWLKKRGVVNATIDKYHSLLNVIGDFFQESTGAEVSPLRKIRGYRKRFPRETPTRDINFLTPEEIDQVDLELKRSSSELLRPFAQFLVHSGLRRGEAFLLKWTDLDLKSGFIHVRKAKRNKTRTIPLEPQAWDAVAPLRKNGIYVFTTQDGDRIHSDSLLKPLQRAVKRAGIDRRVDLHTLRHSFGSNKIRAGWGLKKVSVLLGHSDISITASIYSHLLDGDLKVRDEVRLDFDNETSKPDIDRVKDADQKMANLLAQAITQSLGDTPEGQRALLRLIQKFPEESGKIRKDLPLTPEKGRFATLMLHEAPATLSGGDAVSSDCSDLASDSDDLRSFKMEPMIRIERTTYALRKRCSTD